MADLRGVAAAAAAGPLAGHRRRCGRSRSAAPGSATWSAWSPTTSRSGCWRGCGCASIGTWNRWRRPDSPQFRRGDLLARLVDDVDAVQDLSLRVLQPAAVAAAAAAASVGLVALLLPSAAAVLLAALLVAAVAVPAATAWAGRRAETRLAGARAELTVDVVALLRAAPDLIAFGAAAAQLDRIDARDAELTRIARRGATATGLGAGLAALCSGLAVWGSLTVGGARRAGGRARRGRAGRRRAGPARRVRGRPAAARRRCSRWPAPAAAASGCSPSSTGARR